MDGLRFLEADASLVRLPVIASVANISGGFLHVGFPVFMREVAGAEDTRLIALTY